MCAVMWARSVRMGAVLDLGVDGSDGVQGRDMGY